jgi:hypothetical protein
MDAGQDPEQHRFIQVDVDRGAGHVLDPTRWLLTPFKAGLASSIGPVELYKGRGRWARDD